METAEDLYGAEVEENDDTQPEAGFGATNTSLGARKDEKIPGTFSRVVMIFFFLQLVESFMSRYRLSVQ